MQYLHSVSIIIVCLTVTFLLSENKKSIKYKSILIGLMCQFLFAYVFLNFSYLTKVFYFMNTLLENLNKATLNAMQTVFGQLANPPATNKFGYMLAIHGLPVLITISALSAVLTHWRILPFVINIFSLFFKRLFHIGSALGFSVTTNIVNGMTETPLVIRSYLKRFTRSELFTLMLCGTSSASCSVMFLYALLLDPFIDTPIKHIFTASVMSLAGSLYMSRIMIPETHPLTESYSIEKESSENTFSALYKGILEGSKVAGIIIIMLIGTLSLVNMANLLLSEINIGLLSELTLQKILGFLFYPILWLLGIPSHEALLASTVLGTKIALNEIIGLQEFSTIQNFLSSNTKIILLYSLVSFANIGSIAILIGTYGVLIPKRRKEITSLAFKAVITGLFVNLMNSAIIAVLI